MAKPILLKPAEREPESTVIKALRCWLEDAKAGNLRGLILLGVQDDGITHRAQVGEMGYANAIYLAQLTIHENMRDSLDIGEHASHPEPPEDDTDA